MVLYRLPRVSAVLLAATLVGTPSAVDFSGENDVTQTAATVAPDKGMGSSDLTPGVNGFGTEDSPTQWTQTASSSNNVPTMAPATPIFGDQGWPQQTQPTTSTSFSGWVPSSANSGGYGDQGWPSSTPSTASSSAWTPSSGQSSGNGDQSGSQPAASTASSSAWTNPSSEESSGNQGWAPGDGMDVDCSGSNEVGVGMDVDCSGSNEGGFSPETAYSLECSGSEEASTPFGEISLECSGSEDAGGSQETSETSTEASGSATPASTPSTPLTPSTPSTPSTSSGSTQDQDQGSSQTTQPPSTGSSSNTALSTASSGNIDQGSSPSAPTPSAGSSSATTSTSTSSGTGEQEGSNTKQTASTGEHAAFGDITSGSDKCVVGNPDKYISAADVDWIWEHRMGENVTNNKNWIMDHIVANKGTLNYCVRWDSDGKLSKTVASKFKAMLERQYQQWNHWLIGYNCWPYTEIKVNMVGFAVKDASLLDWTDDSLGKIYAGDLDPEGIPQCPKTCYRFFDNAPTVSDWTDTSSCEGEPFDLSLWPKQGLQGGFGYDWGQEVNLENMIENIDQESLHIVAHEMGHGFGLPDFYEPQDQPNEDFPAAIMKAGSSMTVTDSDGWMIRRVLEHLKSRYDF